MDTQSYDSMDHVSIFHHTDSDDSSKDTAIRVEICPGTEDAATFYLPRAFLSECSQHLEKDSQQNDELELHGISRPTFEKFLLWSFQRQPVEELVAMLDEYHDHDGGLNFITGYKMELCMLGAQLRMPHLYNAALKGFESETSEHVLSKSDLMTVAARVWDRLLEVTPLHHYVVAQLVVRMWCLPEAGRENFEKDVADFVVDADAGRAMGKIRVYLQAVRQQLMYQLPELEIVDHMAFRMGMEG